MDATHAPTFDSAREVSSCFPPSLISFGPSGIEPLPHPPHGCILPLYYGPSCSSLNQEKPILSTWDMREKFSTEYAFSYEKSFGCILYSCMARESHAANVSSRSFSSRGGSLKAPSRVGMMLRRATKGKSASSLKKENIIAKQPKRATASRQRRAFVPIVSRKKENISHLTTKKKVASIFREKKKTTLSPKTLSPKGGRTSTKSVPRKKTVVKTLITKKPTLKGSIAKKTKKQQPKKKSSVWIVASPNTNTLLKRLERYESNPIILPRDTHVWESWQTFNPGSVLIDGKIHLFYRAMGPDGQSRVGHAVSDDAYTIDERADTPVFEHATLMPFRMNPVGFASGGGWAGAEDPRVVYIPEDKRVYLTYTACDGGLKMGISSITIDDVRKRNWNWTNPSIMSHPYEYHKNWMIFPEKIHGKYAILHGINVGILIEYVDSLDFAEEEYIPSKYRMEKRYGVWDTWVRGPAAPPIRTPDGWLVFYHAVTHDEPWKYKVGAMLLDLEDPTKVIHRTSGPILVPTEEYEYNGVKGGIVYVSGVVVKDDMLYVYYGASDNYVCVAAADFGAFMNDLRKDATPKVSQKAVMKKTRVYKKA